MVIFLFFIFFKSLKTESIQFGKLLNPISKYPNLRFICMIWLIIENDNLILKKKKKKKWLHHQGRRKYFIYQIHYLAWLIFFDLCLSWWSAAPLLPWPEASSVSELLPFSVDVFLNKKLSRCKMFAPRQCITACPLCARELLATITGDCDVLRFWKNLKEAVNELAQRCRKKEKSRGRRIETT